MLTEHSSKFSLFIIIFVLALIFIASCQKQSTILTKKEYYIFGTIIEVLVWHDDEKVVANALFEVETELNGMHTQWHAWKPGRLNKINNALRSNQSFEITHEEREFIQTTIKLSEQSLGYFNPAIGELINRWGFHTDHYPILEPPPTDADIQKLVLKKPSMQDLKFSDSLISSSNEYIWLDFGGVAKGYAIDKAINILKSNGIENAIVNAGGDLRSIGKKGQKKWKVAIRKPNSEDILTSINVDGDESIFTSGNYERYKEFDGKRHAHIIDPFTGYGVEEIVSATVIAENGTKADAAATALIVAGIENWRLVSESMKLDQVLLINADSECFATKAFMERIDDNELTCRVDISDI